MLGKLRNDQRTARADFANPVSRAPPKDVAVFDFIEGFSVVEPRCAIGVGEPCARLWRKMDGLLKAVAFEKSRDL